jgi:hypothetical protein
MTEKPCLCGSGLPSTDQYDGHGIYLTRTCDKCDAERMKQFRPDIHERYDADEPIDED